MRRLKLVGILTLFFVVMLSLIAVAGTNPLGVADKYRVTFAEPFRVADTLLPKGEYEIRHVMEGEDHIMVFHQLRTKKPVEVRAKCTLVPLEAKATNDQKIFTVDAANEHVLQELIFAGDKAKHVF
jgi:hypothetical protein